jgi:dCMP deaminase
MNRLSWDQVWSNFASTISQRSTDPKVKVGCIIVPFDNTGVLSLGYNGDEKGGSNLRDSESSGHSGFIHAEINALIKMDFNNPKPKKMYVTHSPCRMCAKAIINADIKEVYYIEEYKSDLVGLELLSKHNIKTHKINN